MNVSKIIQCCLVILFALPVDGSISKLERKYGKTKTAETTSNTPAKNVKINKTTKRQSPIIQKKESITVMPAPPSETKPQPTYTEAEIADLKKRAKVYDVDALNKLVDIWDNDHSLIQEDEAIKILQTATAMGNSKAMGILSNYNRNGILGDNRGRGEETFSPSTNEQADSLHGMTAEQIRELGVDYAEGRNGKSVDEQEAIRLYIRAADMGDIKAQRWMGWRYRQGRGVPKDEQRAKVYFRAAAQQGDESAVKALLD